MKYGRFINLLLTLLRVGLGVFFLFTALQKVAHMNEMVDFLTRSRILPAFFSFPMACIGLAMEIVVAVCLLSKRSYRGATVWGVVMCGTFLLLYFQAWMRGLELSCNCLGSMHEITNYPFDTGMRLLLLGAMLLLFWDSRRPAPTFMKLRKYEFEDF
ncbi:MAG: hypothetical protein IKK73_05090 [Akkermansia sp.]|nr:hypothetical protein [Akkermansia sp.]MBR6576489.1 hypothetical protein [Akkermansia sp.]